MTPHSPQFQLSLPFSRTPDALRHRFEECLARPVALVLTDNSTTMLSARAKDGVLCVRLHRMFLSAEDPVIDEVISHLRRRRTAMPRFRRFLREHRAELSSKPAKKLTVRTRGRFHDLAAIYDEVNREYFGGGITAAITWGTRSPRTAVRKRTVGSYSERSNRIRINPVLDKKSVPRVYVAFIVYHEMLHADMGSPVRGKRRSIHSREFRRREKLYREYDQAVKWEGGDSR